jgi:hypothetical protein
VLQALYFCKPFREKIIEYKLAYNQRINSKDLSNNNNNEAVNTNNSTSSLNDSNSNVSSGTNAAGTNSNGTNIISINKNPPVSILKQEHLLNCLAELFYSIVTMKKKKGIVQPKKFITRLRKDNGIKKSFIQSLYFA